MLEGPGDVSAPTFIGYFRKGRGGKTKQRSSKVAVQEKWETVNAAKVLNIMDQVMRESPEGVKKDMEAQCKRDIDPAQGMQRQEAEAGSLRSGVASEQNKVCREEAARLRQRIKHLEGIMRAMSGSRVRSQASASQQRVAERKAKEKQSAQQHDQHVQGTAGGTGLYRLPRKAI